MRPREGLSESEVEQLDQVRLACPDIARACDLARVFQDLVRNRRGHLLLEWIRQAESDGHGPMRSFAGFLRQDLDAVTAGLTHTWSSGMVEGHVNRVKTLKRAIYGRASFRLLRIRILTRPRGSRNYRQSHCQESPSAAEDNAALCPSSWRGWRRSAGVEPGRTSAKRPLDVLSAARGRRQHRACLVGQGRAVNRQCGITC
ncbi:transposase [Streptomyces sp. NPDC002221]|uniref:transposase n=1 Tax=Streptomyces sp. NPDC002221 TaxID=3364639 RepID=UPI003677A4D4